MKVIDSHIHRYPDEVIQNPIGWAQANDELHWKALVVGTPEKPSIQGWANREKLIADMDAAGIEKVVMQGWYWEHQKTCAWHNNWHAKWLKEDPHRLIAFSCVQPKEGVRALEDLKKAVDLGAKGIGEVFPNVQGFSMDDSHWLKIVEFAIDNKLPVTMHVTEPVGHKYSGKVYAPLADYQWLVQEYPELKLILAHWGGLLPFYELNSVCKKAFKNVYYDTAASPLLYDKRIYRSVVDIVGAKKVLFGSDYPLRVYPRKQRESNFSDALEELRDQSDLSVEKINQITRWSLLNLIP